MLRSLCLGNRGVREEHEKESSVESIDLLQ